MTYHTEKFYLTEEGLKRLKKEYENLQKITQLKIRENIPEIFHSEELNPEYLAYQEDNELLQSRLADLKNILKNVILIKTPDKKEQNIINLGAEVLVGMDGRKEEFKILGSLEASPSSNIISNESPAGKALLGHKVGDIITIPSARKTVFKILKIKYA